LKTCCFLSDMHLKIHFDGGARGNPGPAGAGVVIESAEDGPLFVGGFFLGRMTNNAAEYNGLLRALEAARRLDGSHLSVYSDSELLVRQINGEYRVKNAALKELFDEAYAQLRGFERWEIRHVRREANGRADHLANLAMDAEEDVIEVDATNVGRGKRKSSPIAPRPATVIARCRKTPAAGTCPAPCKKGDELVFEATVPAGLCLDVAPAILQAVKSAAAGEATDRASCPRKGCGAEFDVIRP